MSGKHNIIMLIGQKKVVYDSPMNCVLMKGCALKNVDMYNYLGVHIDRELIFDEFLKQKCNKINLSINRVGSARVEGI